MKKTLILLVLIFLSNIGNCQEYEAIVDTTKMWVVFESPADLAPWMGRSYAFKIANSIQLDSLNWYKVWKAGDSLYTDWQFEGYIREENKIVSFQHKDFVKIIDTIYNFNLTIKDSVVSQHDCLYYIIDIDTVYFAGENRLSQYLGYNMEAKHYEGVGSNIGLISPFFYCSTGVCRELICYYKNGELLYHNPNFESSCYINTLGINDNKISGLKVYQNSATNKLIIKIPETYNDISITIYNLIGGKISHSKINSTSTQISLTDLNSGVYLYLIKNKRKILSSGKIIIN
ncbi:MAG: T9SS type A sorting domain-containing protein [Bacteroidetes bacterium]|nr:T9SS type A sorting domain-containing protein [Bacteroidota bacterium]